MSKLEKVVDILARYGERVLEKDTAAASQVSQAGDAATAEAQLTEVNRPAHYATVAGAKQESGVRQ